MVPIMKIIRNSTCRGRKTTSCFGRVVKDRTIKLEEKISLEGVSNF